VDIALAPPGTRALIEQAGAALGAEAKLKGARVLLAPTVNLPAHGLQRSELAVAYVRGVQSTGVAATIKHYVGNESDINA
jgi:beta-glucosidase